jgi:preprotein translocase subunit SecG
MQSVMITIQLLVSVALVGVILLQRSEGGALGMGGGGLGLGGLFSPRGAADTLTKTTAVLAVLFFVSSFGLTLFSLHGKNESLLQNPTTGPSKTFELPKKFQLPTLPQKPAVPAPH